MTEIIKCWKASNLLNIKRKNCVVSKKFKNTINREFKNI